MNIFPVSTDTGSQMKEQAFSLFIVFCSLITFIIGCGDSNGHRRYAVSGNVTYDGESIPVGVIRFTPDRQAGNDGPGAAAEIKDGYYSLSSSEGVIGGPHEIIVMGYDGIPYQDSEGTNQEGQPIFKPYQLIHDLDHGGNFDVEVPEE